MITPFEVTTDADAAASGSGGVQIHVDITQVPVIPPLDGLAGTGIEIPVLAVIAAIILIGGGLSAVVWGLRRPA